LCAGFSIADRLEAVAAAILTRVLAPESIGLVRMAVAEARRFPDVATSVSRMARDRQAEAVIRVLAEFAESDPMGAAGVRRGSPT
jgi:AefR-like transcriptional repressor, C-terminal domain